MAGKNQTVVSVGIDSKQAVQELEKLKAHISGLTERLSKLAEKLKDPSTWGPNDTESKLQRQYTSLSKEIDGVMKTYEQGVKRVAGIDEQLKTVSEASYNALTRLRTTLTNSLKNARLNTDEDIKAYEQAAKRLQRVRDEIAKRDIDMRGGMTEQKAAEVMKAPTDYSKNELQDAIKVTERLRDMQVMGNKAWKEYATQADNANKVLKSFTDQTKLQAMTAQYKNLGELSKSALSDQKKYWQEMVDGAAAGSKELATYESRLKKVIAEEQGRTKEQAGKVMGNLSNYSVNEIKEAIKATEQLRDAQKPGSKAWAEYAAQVKNASDYLDSFKNKAQLEAMNTQFKDLGKLSADALAEQKKYWQSMVSGAANGSKELEQYRKKLAEVTAEEQKRNAASVKNVMANPAKYSVNEIKEAIKVTEQLRDAQVPGSKAWKDYAAQVTNANAVLDKFKDNAKLEAMTAQFRNLGSLSKSALAEQKKFWQAMADGAAAGSKELELYQRNLKYVINQERSRTREQGKELAKNVLGGQWTGTVGEAKEAVKVLKDYKDTLSTTDTAGLKRVDKAISELTNKTKIAEAGFKSTNDALKALVRQTKNLGYGNYKGSIAELEEMRRKLITIRETQDKVLSAKDRERLRQSLQRVDKELAILKGDAVDVNHVLMNMRSTPLSVLEKAASELQREIRDCSEATADFANKSAQLRRINAQIDKLKKKFKDTENVVVRTAKRLMAYVAVYGGFNFAIGKVRELAQANLQLSDTFADVQKTTGLAYEEIKELSASINAIDTRTTQQQLHELAATAGQLGLKSQTDILGFVKAANMISVSLNELGAEGTSSLMKIATLTGEASAGTEKALLSIGSAINELTANSAATAGPIVDLMNRMGGVAAQAGLTSAQMAAIGATADALGQSMEITGTSMNKFLTTLMSNSDQIAYALNMDAKALRNLVNEGKSMEAMIAIFERMQSMGGLDKMAGVMGELGSEGARMTQVLAALATKVDFLKSQVELSTDAYKEADSIQKEYNIKNENALAIWQRIGNTLREQIVNSGFVDILTSITRSIHGIVQSIVDGGSAFRIFTATIWGLTAALIANRIAWVKNMNALKFSAGIKAVQQAIESLIVSLKNATFWENAANSAATKLSMSWKRMLVVLRANWLTALIAGLAAFVGWLKSAVTFTSELTRATVRYRREVEEEKSQVDALFLSLQRTNKEENSRAKIIEQINRRYGDYLGFMLSEKDSAEKLAAAHRLINSELEKRMALNLQSTLQGNAANTYAQKYEEETTDIERSIKGEGLFNSDKFKNLVNAGEVNAFVNKLVNDAVSNAIDTSGDYRKIGEIDMDEVMQNIKSQLQERFNTDKDKEIFRDTFSQQEGLGGMLYGQIKGNIENLLEARIDFMEDTFAAEEAAEVEMGRITRASIEEREKILKQTEEDYKSLEKLDISSMSEEQQREHYAKMLDEAQDYVDNAKKILREIPESEREITNDQLNANITRYENEVKRLAPLADIDPLGKKTDVKDWKDFADIVTNLDTSSAEALAAAYKKITEDTAKIPSNVKKFYEMFEGTGLETKLNLQNPDDIAKQVHLWAEQIKDKLKTKYGRNTSLGFIFDSEGSGGNKSAEREARQEMNAALAALEEHFLKRKAIVQQAYLDEKISGAEMQRQIADNDEEFRLARIELRKLLAGDANKFNQSLYPELSGKDLQRTSKMLQAIGDAVIDGLRKNVQKDEVEIREGAIKIRQAFEAEMLKGDYFGVLADNFRDTMDELMLLSSEYERGLGKAIEVGTNGVVKAAQTKGLGLSEQEQKERLSALQGWSEKVNTMTDEMLKNMMLKEGQFSNWLGKLNEDQIQALINKLREYKDSYDEVIKKEAEQMKKLTDARFKGTGQQQTAESRVQTAEGAVEVVDQLSGMGVQGLDPAQYETEINLIKEKMAYQIEWINLLKQEQSIKMQNLQEDLKAAEQRRNDATTVEDQKEAELEIARIRREIAAQTASYNMAVSESSEKMLELQNEAIRKYQEQMTRHMDTFQEYSGHLDDFALAMGKGIYGSKEDRQQAARDLLSSVATTTKNVIQQWLMEVTMKKLIDEQELAAERYKQAQLRMIQIQSLASTGQTMIGEMTAGAALSAAQIELNAAEAASKEAAKKGWIGLAIGAAISVALSALLGAALGKINKAKSEVAAATGAGGGRLATGMLTYAEGNYPVLGNDGNVYNAKYEGSGMKTGIYRGGAHFGIFSEKKPEAIIDGDTTQRLIMNHPDIWKAIVTLSKNGRLDSGMGMRTFATGNINDLARQAQDMEASATTDNNVQYEMMQEMRALMSANLAIMNKLAIEGVHSNINMYGDDGLYKSMKKAEKYAGRVGYK